MKKIEFIKSAAPSITNKEINLVNKAVSFGWGKNMNLYIDKFSKKFSKFVRQKYFLPTSHCTDAIHLALLSIGIKKNDEVIVPDLTWVASAAPIVHVGAVPIFADIDLKNYCISLSSIKQKITKKTKAIIVVDLLGSMPEWKEIKKFCRKKKIIIIEDAAEGLGAYYDNKPAGSFGDISVFSFNATKLIMAGQGGALCTNNFKFYEKAVSLSQHGIDKSKTGKYYWSNEIGFNYRWSNIQAALGLAQFDRIKSLLRYKTKIHNLYYKHINQIEEISFLKNNKKIKNSFWINPITFSSKVKHSKEYICDYFLKNKIDMRPMFYTLSSMPPFKKFLSHSKNKITNKNSKLISDRSILLPNGYDLNEASIIRIKKVLLKLLSHKL